MYDIRVCKALNDFGALVHMNWSIDLWREHGRFLRAVRTTAPPGMSLPDYDRWLWGSNKRRAMIEELGDSASLGLVEESK